MPHPMSFIHPQSKQEAGSSLDRAFVKGMQIERAFIAKEVHVYTGAHHPRVTHIIVKKRDRQGEHMVIILTNLNASLLLT